MKEKIRVFLADIGNDPQTLEIAKTKLLKHFPSWAIETGSVVKLDDFPDIIIRNIKNGNGAGLKMDITSCVSFLQQTIRLLEVIKENVYD